MMYSGAYLHLLRSLQFSYTTSDPKKGKDKKNTEIKILKMCSFEF